MARIEVRFEDDQVAKQLTKQARENGYRSREEYLKEILTEVANGEYQSDTAALYRQALAMNRKAMEQMFSALILNIELGLVSLPKELLEEGNDSGE
ncbi:hypothetical protein D2A86_10120 [Enterococcus faecalis]|nr:hypothetical protein [Enterococcus faecalis]EGO9005201.1 hypothetical protein [Enterococcus faecalis]EGO9160563.1 hypothetical protein [Enterococcus faecalis]EHL2494788.1 hypothetical protein [Enterococcus faecalis]EKJ3575741.1 hypothetical protein [Enterococcus faecalis]